LAWLAPGSRTPVTLEAAYPENFHPHGIDAIRLDRWTTRVFVVNHRNDATPSIELFDLDPTRSPPGLRHVETIRGSLLRLPNDIAARGSREFFLTDNPVQTDLSQRLAIFLGIPRGRVLYFDAYAFSIVADGLAHANGIVRERKAGTIRVAETLTGTIQEYGYSEEGGSMSLEKTAAFSAATGVDNLSRTDREGDLLAATHPNLLALAAHRSDPSRLSPWRVYAGNPHDSVVRLHPVTEGDGSTLSGVSVAVEWEGHYVLGAVATPELLLIPLEAPPEGHPGPE
jgi:hypothetical protein